MNDIKQPFNMPSGTESDDEMPMEDVKLHHQAPVASAPVLLPPNMAFRTKNKKHDPAPLQDYSTLLQELIVSLTNITKVNSKGILCLFMLSLRFLSRIA